MADRARGWTDADDRPGGRDELVLDAGVLPSDQHRGAAAPGGHASAQVALQSLDFAAVRRCQQDEDWTAAGRLLGDAARRCEAGGADVVLICTNLMHKVADAVADSIQVPLLHIADAVAGQAQRNGWPGWACSAPTG